MKRQTLPTELIFQVFTLLIAFIIVHASYVTIIRPRAAASMAEKEQLLLENPSHVLQRNFYVVLKDYEQEACFVLMLWALAILSFKGINGYRQRQLLDEDLLQLPPTLPIGPEDTRTLLQNLSEQSASVSKCLLPKALTLGIQRFGVTGNIQDSATAVGDLCESEMERQESELSIIRYIAWAIPSIGFIGTVRGIGEELAQADKAVQGDIAGVTQSLGVAFNSTFIALLISIFLMFLVYQLQLLQERLVFDGQNYVDDKLVRHMKSD